MDVTPSSPLRLWIVEDEGLYRATLTLLIASAPEMRCEGVFDTGEALLDALDHQLHAEAPHVILMDVNLPGISGIECLNRVKRRISDLKVVMLTIRDDRETVFNALCAGASGYVLKNSSVDEILGAVRQAHSGGMLMPAPIARMVLGHFRAPLRAEYGLSVREKEVLEKMTEGLTQKEIGAALCISPPTVSVHIQHIYRKLHVNTINAAVAKAIREGVV